MLLGKCILHAHSFTRPFLAKGDVAAAFMWVGLNVAIAMWTRGWEIWAGIVGIPLFSFSVDLL